MDTGLYTLYSTACEAIILFDNNPAGGTREGGFLGLLSASQAVSWVYSILYIFKTIKSYTGTYNK